MNLVFETLFIFILIIKIYSIKLSIIIPVYNTEPYLKRCITSAINQTLKDIEIICVDDGSTDNSLKILKSFERKDERVKVVHLEKNGGPSIARNAGIDIATGEFIGFMDSDDYADVRFFEFLYSYSKDQDIVNGIFVNSINKSSYYAHHNPFNYITGYVFDSIFRLVFIKRNNVRFPENKKLAEDVDFRRKCYSLNPRKIETPDVGIYYYYKQRTGSTWKKSKKNIEKVVKMARKESIQRKKKLLSIL